MSLRFLCPEGHVLEVDESHAGKSSSCPICNASFLVPDVTVHAHSTGRIVFDQSHKSPTLQVPCPAGHELETPREMLGRYAICPICEARFRLLESNSVEYQRRAERERARLERRVNQFWLRFSVAAVAIVSLGLVVFALSS